MSADLPEVFVTMINLVREKNPMPEQAPDIRNKNFLEVATGYTEEMAIREAMRCLSSS